MTSNPYPLSKISLISRNPKTLTGPQGRKRKLEESLIQEKAKQLRVDEKAREALEKVEESPLIEACTVTNVINFLISIS